MITKQLLDKVEAWEVTINFGHFTAHDIFILHFHQWWKRDMKIKLQRNISNRDFDEGSYTHSPTEQSLSFQSVLNNHINTSYHVTLKEGKEGKLSKKCTVLKLVANNDDK